MPGKFITCAQLDITDSKSDAIVNTANNHLWMGTGVAGAIKRKGGEKIETEAIAKGPIAVGEALATSAGRLSARYVIHAAVMGQDLKTDAEKIKKAVYNSLACAENLGLFSIDFPALGTGVGRFSVKEVAEILIETAKDFLANSKSIKKIGFVLYDDLSYQIFKEKLGNDQLEV